MSTVPEDPPDVCPVCSADYESVSTHEGGLTVALRENERYRRVCFDPRLRGDAPVVDFYHHTHEQTTPAST
jgi:hypothetical protein